MELGYNALILIIVYLLAELAKRTIAKTDERRALLPYAAVLVGALVGIILYSFFPQWLDNIDNYLVAVLTGAGSGLLATGANQLYKQANKIARGDFKGISSDLDKVIADAEQTVAEDKQDADEAEKAKEDKAEEVNNALPSDYDPSKKI